MQFFLTFFPPFPPLPPFRSFPSFASHLPLACAFAHLFGLHLSSQAGGAGAGGLPLDGAQELPPPPLDGAQELPPPALLMGGSHDPLGGAQELPPPPLLQE